MTEWPIFLQEERQKVEAEMETFIEKNTNDDHLKKSMLYSLQAGGKRIRPLLLLTTIASFGKKASLGDYQVAASLEMIHTYSLIHDDLPAMDNDALRRGKPTNHIVFGAGMATLAGDGLLTGAFQLLSTAAINDSVKIRLIQLLTQAAGTQGMVAGQALDIASEEKKIALEDLIHIHERKTGALLCFATMAGGLLAQQPESVITTLRQMGVHLGLAFQIRDDLLDVLSTEEKMGKATKKDDQAGKNTYPGLLGVKKSEEALTNELQAAHLLLNQMGNEFDKTNMTHFLNLFSLERGLS